MDEQQLTKFMKASREGKLSTGDRKFLNSFATAKEELMRNISAQLESAPADLKELEAMYAEPNIQEEKRYIMDREKERVLSLIKDSETKKYPNADPVAGILDVISSFISPANAATRPVK